MRLNSEIVAKMGIFEHLTAAVRRRMLHSNVPVAFLCSGGIDSILLWLPNLDTRIGSSRSRPSGFYA